MTPNQLIPQAERIMAKPDGEEKDALILVAKETAYLWLLRNEITSDTYRAVLAVLTRPS
jgi:hypothetical protein